MTKTNNKDYAFYFYSAFILPDEPNNRVPKHRLDYSLSTSEKPHAIAAKKSRHLILDSKEAAVRELPDSDRIIEGVYNVLQRADDTEFPSIEGYIAVEKKTGMSRSDLTHRATEVIENYAAEHYPNKHFQPAVDRFKNTDSQTVSR